MPEFQAVILACDIDGSDAFFSSLVDVTEQPRALLPVCNRPLLYHQLRLLERAGFADVIVVCEERHKKPLADFVYKGALKIDFVALAPAPGADSEAVGTAEALVQLKSRLKSDFFVLAGDLVTEASLHELADTFRTKDATACMLLKEYDLAAEDKASKGQHFSRAAGLAAAVTTFVGLAEVTDRAHARVVLLKSPFFSDRVDGGLAVGRALLETAPKVEVHTNLVDCHLYVFKHWVLDLAARSAQDFSSVRNDLLPYLVNLQFQPRRQDALGPELWAKARSKQALALQTRGDDDRVRVFALRLPYSKGGGSFSSRADGPLSWAWMNLALLEHAAGESTPWEPLTLGQHARSPDLGGQGPAHQHDKVVRSVLGEACTVPPSCVLNKCVIGDGCRLGAGCKLINCVVLAGAEIKDGAIVQHSIVGARAVIGSRAELNRCIVGSRCVVADGRREEGKMFAAEDEHSD